MVQTEVDDAEVEDTENEIAKMSESGLYKFCSLISPNQLPSENFYGLLTSDINHRKYDGECKKYNGPGKATDFKERKLLYDYYVDYNTILEKSAETNKCRDYYKYVQSKQRLYDIFEKHCISDGSAQCPEFYKDCKDYNPKEVLDTFICHDDMVRAGVGVYSGRKSGLWGRTVSFLNSSGAARKGSSALLGMVVASVTGGILYKFTPLGEGARSRVGKEKQIKSDINEKPPEVFIYKSDSYNPHNDDAEEHYIGYQPV
ncbi:VIR protein [Plasmodium vivax]|uniref:VIR protein n=1 Tax=Plasmodium vivax TaxID=5855 RepID=A0A1G4GSG6_PLAVI|nr:VIR protein [Plasmodium vivax]